MSESGSGTNGNNGKEGGSYQPLGNSQEAALSNRVENLNLNENGASAPPASGNGQSGAERLGSRIGSNKRYGEEREVRGTKRRKNLYFSNTRMENYPKSGTGGKPLSLVANFFKLTTKPQWTLYNYRVDFKNLVSGEEEYKNSVRKRLLNQHRQDLPNFIFDGSNMYTIAKVMPDPMILTCQRDDGVRFEITIRLVAEVAPWDADYFQFFDIIMKTCLTNLNLDQIGKYYFDHSARIGLPDLNLTLLPGYMTNIRRHDAGLMMYVELTHKVLRNETCLDVIRILRNQKHYEAEIHTRLAGSFVMTSYNNKTYKIFDIDWKNTPQLNFNMRGVQTSLVDYYRNKYNLNVSDVGMSSPLLVSLPTRRDKRRGQTDKILLIPEFCRTTGLIDEDKANYRKMHTLSQYLQQSPQDRYQNIVSFFRRLRGSQETSNLFTTWDLDFDETDFVSCNGRVLNPSKLCVIDAVANKMTGFECVYGDWTPLLRKGSGKKLANPQGLRKWIVIATERDAQYYNINELIRTMTDVGMGMGIDVPAPEIVTTHNYSVEAFSEVLDKIGKEVKNNDLDLIFVIMPFLRELSTILYSTIKRKCCIDLGVNSQCFQSRHLAERNIERLPRICTMLMTQISAKLGGEPWKLLTEGIITEPTMIVGFDIHRPVRRTILTARYYGAMVSTTNPGMSKFFSTVSKHGPHYWSSEIDISASISKDIMKCVIAFQIKNNRPPSSIIFYRDGVGEGQLERLIRVEVIAIKERLTELYTRNKAPPPKLTYIVVTKKENARLFMRKGEEGSYTHGNPPPGTVVDNTITLPDRYDFILISHSHRTLRDQSVSPTTYNVIHDEIKKSPSEMQNLTYKLCHMYFNWTGTVPVPAVCQYAHKLASLAGTTFSIYSDDKVNKKLNNCLYFL